MSNGAEPGSMTPFMLSNLYLYRYASLFQALYAWHGVPINVWFTTFYKSIKVPSPPPRYRFPSERMRHELVREWRTRTHTRVRTRTSIDIFACVCTPDRASLDAFATHTRESKRAGSRIPVLSTPPPHRLIRDSAVSRWDNIWLGDARPDRQAR